MGTHLAACLTGCLCGWLAGQFIFWIFVNSAFVAESWVDGALVRWLYFFKKWKVTETQLQWADAKGKRPVGEHSECMLFYNAQRTQCGPVKMKD